VHNLTAISNRLGLPKSTTHRLLTTLVGQGFLMRDVHGRGYQLGYQLLHWGMVAQAASVPDGPPAVSRAPATAARGGTITYEPLREAEAAVARAVAADKQAQASAPAQPALPTADEISARGGVPELHLDLHVYGARTQDRFIFVNSRKYREGDTLQEGPIVEQITESGAVLNYKGSRFILSRD
jgi:general secretion pathway protein B